MSKIDDRIKQNPAYGDVLHDKTGKFTEKIRFDRKPDRSGVFLLVLDLRRLRQLYFSLKFFHVAAEDLGR